MLYIWVLRNGLSGDCGNTNGAKQAEAFFDVQKSPGGRVVMKSWRKNILNVEGRTLVVTVALSGV